MKKEGVSMRGRQMRVYINNHLSGSESIVARGGGIYKNGRQGRGTYKGSD